VAKLASDLQVNNPILKEIKMPQKFILFYGKYSVDRKRNVKNHGTYFGAAGDDIDVIRQKGIEIAQEHPNLIVIPKTFDLDDTLDSVALDAQEHFEQFGEKLQKHQ
jgi:hypothetical protein